jgi:hypothetical protein
MTSDKPWQESLEEEATTWHETTTMEGKAIRVGTHTKTSLLQAQKDRIKRGKNVIEPFTEWLITHYGIQRPYARQQATLAWSVYEETHGNPVSIIQHDITVSYYNYIKIRSALSRFATWISTREDGSDSTRQIGRRISNELLRLPRRGRQTHLLPDPRGAFLSKNVPYSHTEETNIYIAVERIKEKYGSRWPWFWATIRIYLRVRVTPEMLVHMKRSDAVYALQRHLAGEVAGIPLWSRRTTKRANAGGTRTIPVSLIKDELLSLVYWPYEWSTLADLIAPRIPPERRVSVATRRVKARFKDVIKESGVPWDSHNSNIRIKYTAMRRIYEETKDLLLLQQIFGVNAARLKRFPWIRKISDKIGKKKS